jgi:hypothetical protein
LSRASASVAGAFLICAAAASCGGRPGITAPDAGAPGAKAGPNSAVSCIDDGQCPPSRSPCEYATCQAGRCEVVAVAAGTLVAVDRPADCLDTVCDGAGATVKVLDQRNVPADPGPCNANACGADGRISSRPAVAGAPCAAGNVPGLCDGQGACVGCLTNTDCTDATICGSARACVPPSCDDGVQNGAESDVDCGGGGCALCWNGAHCAYDADCASGLCHLTDHTCGAPTCTDGRKDGDETDRDCGGACAPCAASKECRVDADCATKACDSGLPHRCLLDHCLDGHEDFDETDRDCGGATCAKCIDFFMCKQDSDCQSGHCNVQRGTCLTETCFDGAHDGSETGVDCGGGLCKPCALGQGCGIDFDCASAACDFVARTCVADPCADHRWENDETDIDCGGSCGATCRVGQRCLSATDCLPGLTCNQWRECQ